MLLFPELWSLRKRTSGTVVRGHQKIEVAVAVEVAIAQSAPDPRLAEVRANLRGDVAERVVTSVEKKLRSLRITDIAANIADRFVDVAVCHRKVRQAIEIGVEEHATKSQRVHRGQSHSRLRSHVLVHALADRAVKPDHLIVEVRDCDFCGARAVEIRRVDAHAGSRFAFGAERDARLDGDILERAIALIAVELVRLRIVRNEEIGPAILIVVEHRHAQMISSCCRRCRFSR